MHLDEKGIVAIEAPMAQDQTYLNVIFGAFSKPS